MRYDLQGNINCYNITTTTRYQFAIEPFSIAANSKSDLGDLSMFQ